MPVCKSAVAIASKWARVTPERLDDYEGGVRNPKKDWGKETAAAEGRYEEGIKASIARKAFGKGVTKCGTAGQQEKTIEKGLTRWPEGVRLAEKDMADGMAPVVAVIERTTLPGRYPKGDPRNYERVKAMGTALHNLKIGK
jgi:hypothetical protein